MHKEVIDWLREIWHGRPEWFHGTRVIELGSRLVSSGGTVSNLFSDCEYIGVDAKEGPGVDVVSLAHEYKPEAPADVVACFQMLEHDPHWRQSVMHMPELLKPGGVLLLSFPFEHYPEHEALESPQPGYYHNPDRAEVLDLLYPHFDKLHWIDEGGTILICGEARRV